MDAQPIPSMVPHSDLGAALLAATVEALSRVLLHGGPCRHVNVFFVVEMKS